MIWGDYYAGECVHGRQALACPRCRRRGRDVPTWAAICAAILWLVIVLWLGPRALDLEAANERAHTAAHVAAIGAGR